MIRQFIVFAMLTTCPTLRAEPQDVDLILVLATDVSESIDDDEYALQKDGITAALTDPRMADVLEQCAPRGVALAYLEWSKMPAPVVGLTHVTDQESLRLFAGRIAGADRTSKAGTNVIGALDEADRMIADAPFRASRRVVDISSDGVQNDWTTRRRVARDRTLGLKAEVATYRDLLTRRGIVINALVIDVPGTRPEGTDGEKDLETYYRNHVIGGENAFARVVHNFEDYRTVFTQKLKREICNASAARDADPTVRVARR